MSAQPRLLDRVLHPQLGPGTVVALRVGQRTRVAFDALPSLPHTVACAELATAAPARSRLDKEPKPMHGPMAPPQPLEPGGDGPIERADLRQTLEALRLGVVPARFVRDYTVARDAELESIEALLADRRGLRIVWGDYGAGKTHMLDVTEQLALERGFATARVVLDPHDFSATHPKRIYDAITANLRLPGDVGVGLEALLARLVDSAAHREPDGAAYSRFFSPYLFAQHAGNADVADWLRDYARGDPLDSPVVNAQLRRIGWRGQGVLALSDFRTYGRVYLHMLGTLACWARDAGLAGVLLLFDEVECVDGMRAEQLALAEQVLRHFAAVTVPRSLLGFDPESQTALYRGGHAVHRAIPLRFAADQPLAVVFALTPLPKIQSLLRAIVVGQGLDIALRPIGAKSLTELVRRIAALYARAYPGFDASAAALHEVERQLSLRASEGEDGPRAVVRSAVLLLDNMRFPAASTAT